MIGEENITMTGWQQADLFFSDIFVVPYAPKNSYLIAY